MRNFDPGRIGLSLSARSRGYSCSIFSSSRCRRATLFAAKSPSPPKCEQVIGNDSAGLAFFRNQGPVFYLGLPQPVPQYDKLADINSAVASGQVHWLIVRRRDIALMKFKSEPVAAETLYPWEPKEHGLNSMVLLRVMPTSN